MAAQNYSASERDRLLQLNGSAFFEAIQYHFVSVRDMAPIIKMFKEYIVNHPRTSAKVITITESDWPNQDAPELTTPELAVLGAALGTTVDFRTVSGGWNDKDISVSYFYDIRIRP